ncbi:alpha/beta fold hydrolase [Streptomyces odontomachi]|uniref:alpha/beta fold hydrolase n=1 Tax=Streptomyces odontomachi TaxID=2944940 RepID=UPI00210EA270|nr:alpha/beta hydrolase [Streptomyces sp. ODS25]
MNDIAELKEFVRVHARGQQIPDVERILDRITDDGTGPGSWTGEWSAEARTLEAAGRHLEACRHHIMARFPYEDGPARKEAAEQAVAALDRWRSGSSGSDIHRFETDIDGHRVACWQTGLSPDHRRPLLVLMGGNVSVKEQWAPALPVFRRLGMAAVVVDLPGIGENAVPYDADSWRFLSGLLDALSDQADVRHTYALALSFSGHLALRCAMDDPRIRGVVTAGAPISAFFTDTDWQSRLPRITVAALTHLTGTGPEGLHDWALPAERLARLDIPVAYVASARDEIIPAADVELLRSHVRDLDVLVHDDVHASPEHVTESKLWSARALLRMRGVRDLRSLAIGLMWRTARARGRLPGGARTIARSDSRPGSRSDARPDTRSGAAP